MVVVIVARELAITGLRLLAASKQVVLAAERWGKDKTISQVTAIISVLVLLSYPDWGNWAETLFGGWVSIFTQLAVWVTVLLTLLSGVLYLWRNREIFLQDL
jgi:phosphatidylglycerophosphate synthase